MGLCSVTTLLIIQPTFWAGTFRCGCSIQQTTSSSRYASSSFSLFSSQERSDTNMNEPEMLARLNTTAHFCKVLFLDRELYRFGTAANLRVLRCGCYIQQTTSSSRYSPRPHGGVRPFHQKSTCIMQIMSGPSVVHIWSSNVKTPERTKPANSTVLMT